MSGLREQVAAVIRAHAWVPTRHSGNVGHCVCQQYGGRLRGQVPDHAAHVADAVRAAKAEAKKPRRKAS